MDKTGFGGYDAKGYLELDETTGQYIVDGSDSAEPRNPVRVQFSLKDTGYVQDYEAGENKTPENDDIFYPNVTQFLGDLASSRSIVLLHDSSTEELRRLDIEVQLDLRR